MGGDAHIYYASKEYVFDRPPPEAVAGGDGIATAAAATVLQHPLDAPNGMAHAAAASANGTSSTSTTTTATSAATATLGSAWLAYETAEFTPWEEILLDGTAWMIACILCWDPMRHQHAREEDNEENDDLSSRRRKQQTQQQPIVRRRQQLQRRLAQDNHPPQKHEQEQNQQEQRRNDDGDDRN